ncbi:hypothetical protein ACFVH0_27730 [Streptomyces sp. NPDC127117]|uniref:hypothetical protein n=1 Tax=Streptomyces sp. NPDC127117 TaxID=3345368 RepID=UPI00363A8523
MDMRTTGRRTIWAVVAALTAALLPWQSASAGGTASAAPPPEVLPPLRQRQPGEGEFTLADRARAWPWSGAARPPGR